MVEFFVNIIILFVFPFLFIGIINRTKAFWGGRKGASIMQPLYDFIKLLKKGEVISTTTSFVFNIAPSLMLASVIFAGLLVPMVNNRSILGFEGDFIVFAYILALGKFFSLISAMDTGSSFEGMGASREAALSTFVEPAFFITIASISILSGHYSFQSLAGELDLVIISLAALVIFGIILVEGCRVPVDDPNTHLELTMIHEVMVLDNSGPDLALINYASAMKMVIFTALITNMLHPVMFLVVPLVIGTIESGVARFRMSRLFECIFLICSISLIILALVETIK